MDGSFIATVLETAAVYVLYLAWKNITEGAFRSLSPPTPYPPSFLPPSLLPRSSLLAPFVLLLWKSEADFALLVVVYGYRIMGRRGVLPTVIVDRAVCFLFSPLFCRVLSCYVLQYSVLGSVFVFSVNFC